MLFETVKPRRVVGQNSLGQFYRAGSTNEIIDQRFVAKTTIRRQDGATHVLIVRRRMRPVAAPYTTTRRNAQDGSRPGRIDSSCERIRAHAIWRRQLDPDVALRQQSKQRHTLGLFRSCARMQAIVIDDDRYA